MIQRIYIIENLDCANCAAKIETKMNALPEVEAASITFATRQLRITAEDPDALLDKLTAIARSVEHDAEIHPRTDTRHHHHDHHEHHEGCSCGHHHEHHEDCGCSHHHEHHEECACGHNHHEHHEHSHGDSDGNVIADYGIGPTESTQPAMESGIPSAKNENWSFSEWNFSNVTMIQITNLHNGRYSFITEPEDLTKIISFMQDVSGTNAESARGYYEGSYSLKFYSGDTLVYSMGFGDSPSFFCGDYGDGYPCRYELVELTISEVVAFLSPFDTSGLAWEIV